MRLAVRDVILTQSARKTFAQLQKSLLGTEMEDEVSKAVRKVYPVRSAVIHKSQLLQSGVVSESGPTLDEIHAGEERKTAESAARKAAALAAAADEEEDDTAEEAGVLAAAEALEEVSDKASKTVEKVIEEEVAPVAATPASDDDFYTLPGVGPASAKKLQDAGLGSFAALKDAGVDGISEVKGISAALAGKILDHLS
jgi:predicted flap endonuclease-1-like 5' DNA nuclease